MGGFSFWCKKRDEQATSTLNAEMHFNLWLEYSKNNKVPSFDIGIMINGLSNIVDMNFFVPFKLTIEEISDLGLLLSRNSSILNAVFNENYSFRSQSNGKLTTILKEDEVKFFIYSIDEKNDIVLIEKFGGTIIKINCANIQCHNNIKHYFRIRIKSEKLNCIIKERQSSNAFLQNAISINEFIDFRFNDLRTLNMSLIEEMNSAQMIEITISKIHFFLMTKADVEIKQSYDNERQLESDIWEKYIDIKPTDIIVANHWKIEGDKHCIIFIKLKMNKCNWLTIAIYLVVLASLTIGFNIVSSLICKYIMSTN